LVETQQEVTQVEVQQTEHLQSNTGRMSRVNLALIIIYYVCCILFAGYLFYLSKSPFIKSLSVYMKIGILLLALTYTLWITIIDQLVMFVVRYIRSFVLGVPYTRYKRQ
jgi:uncharacterized membrane protein YdfJ with MMPL/SSD domain